MGQTRMFRDRVVSMEQTLEGGEKHLGLLKELCREALPGFEYRDHTLDHERDLFVMDLQDADGTAKRIAWTRMVLFDADRIPTLTGDPAATLRGKIVEYLRSRATRAEIVVTFRHLEEGWVDTPEPKREGGGRRRRRGGRGGGRGGERGAPERRSQGPSGPVPGERRSVPQRTGGPREASPVATEPGAGGATGAKRRRRFRRRRRGGRGPGGGGAVPSGPPTSGPRT